MEVVTPGVRGLEQHGVTLTLDDLYGLARPQAAIDGVYRCGMDFDQYLRGPGTWFFQLANLQHARRPMAVIEYSSHHFDSWT